MALFEKADDRINRLLRNQPSIHRDGAGNLTNYGIDPALVPYLTKYVGPGCRTMETGSGISTLVFLILGAQHCAVSPDGGEPERIRAYCRENDIATDNYEHIVASSENVLPSLPADPVLDIALVDGDHAFPVPCLDWYFMTRMLKKGGIMVIDDVWLWTGELLADFLDGDDVRENLGRTDRFAVFRLLGESKDVLGRWWGQQPYTVKHSKMKL